MYMEMFFDFYENIYGMVRGQLREAMVGWKTFFLGGLEENGYKKKGGGGETTRGRARK